MATGYKLPSALLRPPGTGRGRRRAQVVPQSAAPGRQAGCPGRRSPAHRSREVSLVLSLLIAVLLLSELFALPVQAMTVGSGNPAPVTAVPPGQVLPPGQYYVNFTETGLPSGTPWNVTFDGVQNGSTGSTVYFAALNGTYSFSVLSVVGYLPSPATGSATVNGTNVSVPVAFALTYGVTFEETGLNGGTNWSVTLGGQTETGSSSGAVVFEEPNGSYSYSVGAVPGYRANPSSGSVSVNGGSPATVAINFTVVTYSVTFSESGLPTGTSWSVLFRGTNSTTTSPSVSLAPAPNGSYPYTISGPSTWRPDPSSGRLNISGAPVSAAVSFSHLWPVTFTESGLPADRPWNVTVNGTQHSTTRATIYLNLTNGSYPFFVGIENGYYPSVASGTLNVAGAATAEAIDWTRATYTVSFQESGLPAQTNWTVSLQSVGTFTTNRSTMAFSVPNGTFAFTISNLTGYSPTPLKGSVTVSGSSPPAELVTFAPTYAVSFSETGLANGTSWSVRLGGNSASGATASLVIPEVSGTYGYSIGGISGYTASPANGTVTVATSPVAVPISFTAVKYNVSFQETGLPPGSAWTVTLGNPATNPPRTSSTPWVNFTAANGTYPWSVGSVPGYVPSPPTGSVRVSGAAVTVSVAFRPQPTYTVTFNATGLPTGLNWSVSLGSEYQNSSASSIVFVESNATYGYAVRAPPGYRASPPSGSVTVHGADQLVNITFTAVVYAVSFTESGLPGGTRWSVTFGTLSGNATTNTIRFFVANGTYDYRIGAVAGYAPSPAAGTLNVSGATASAAIAWSKFDYTLTFGESGLPAGTNWSVALAGISHHGTTPTIVLGLPNGTYSYSLGVVPGYRAPAATGTVTVNGSAETVPFFFSVVTYNVTFREYGLPAGTSWTVEIAGASYSSNVPSLLVAVPNGTYSYTVLASSASGTSWRPTASQGVVNVTGHQNATSVHFSRVVATTSFTFTTFDEQLLAASLVVVLILALIGFIARPINRRRRTGPNPLFPPPDEVSSVPFQPSLLTPGSAAGGAAPPPPREVAPTAANSSALLRIAIGLGQVIAEQGGPEAPARAMELRRAMDLIETNRMTEAFRLLRRLRDELTRARPRPSATAAALAASGLSDAGKRAASRSGGWSSGAASPPTPATMRDPDGSARAKGAGPTPPAPGVGGSTDTGPGSTRGPHARDRL